jgi:hypothetical protein
MLKVQSFALSIAWLAGAHANMYDVIEPHKLPAKGCECQPWSSQPASLWKDGTVPEGAGNYCAQWVTLRFSGAGVNQFYLRPFSLRRPMPPAPPPTLRHCRTRPCYRRT